MTMSDRVRSLGLQLAAPHYFVGEINVMGGADATPKPRPVVFSPPLYIFAPVDEVPYLQAVLAKTGIACRFNAYDVRVWQGLQVCFFRQTRLNPYQLQALNAVRAQNVPVRSLQDCLEKRLNWVEIDLLDAEYLLDIEVSGSRSSWWLGKLRRGFDIMISAVLLLLLVPLSALVALAIKLESPGSVFFIQRRTGLFNREFNIIKFRSMRNDAERSGARWAEKNDARVTRVGRFIRKTRIDELPQLINVLKGEMSLIGPRPEREVFILDLEQRIPFYRFRHMVKPGITGFAQVMYSYGASLEDARQKHRYDLYYLKHRSIWLDLQILWQTARIVVTGQGI